MRSETGMVMVAAVVGLMGIGPALADGDAAAGKKVFNKCRACHSIEPGKNKIGPSLSGGVGREAGTVEGFKYSKAMKSSGVVWDEESLDAYLADPRGYIPKNKMAFAGLRKEDDREDVIAYLKTLE